MSAGNRLKRARRAFFAHVMVCAECHAGAVPLGGDSGDCDLPRDAICPPGRVVFNRYQVAAAGADVEIGPLVIFG